MGEHRFKLRRIEIVSLVVAAMLAAGLLVWGDRMGRAGARTVERFWTGGGSLVVWRSAGGRLTARFTGSGGTAVERGLGGGVAARPVAGGRRPLILVTDASGGHRLLEYDATTTRWRVVLASPDPHDLTSAVAIGALVYVPQGSGRRAAVVAVHPDGRIAATYRLPKLPPDPTALLPGPSQPGPLSHPGRGAVDALLSADGHVLAVTSSRSAAGLTDLLTGRTVTFNGYTQVQAATMGGDGMIYVLTGANDTAFSLRILRIDPRSMQIVSAFDTGALDRGRPATALPSSFGAVIYSPGVPRSLDALSGTEVWLVDGGGLRENATVSSDDGLLMGPGHGDSALLYGGVAGDVVTRVGLSDGAVRRADARLTAPSGTTVVLAAD